MIAPLLTSRQCSLWTYFIRIKEARIMNKATSTLIAAVAALAMSGGVYAQSAGGANGGGGSSGSTASPANQVNNGGNMSGGYGTPGTTNSDMGTRAPNSGLPSGVNSNATLNAAPPTSNNTLATPSVKSPAAQ
jgi:hypothetical protein